MSDSEGQDRDVSRSGEPHAIRPDAQPLRDEELPRVSVAGGAGAKNSPPAGGERRPEERREPRIRHYPEPDPQPPRKAAPKKRPRKKLRKGKTLAPIKPRRKWPHIVLAVIIVLFLVTWLPVLVMRWADPPTTAFMLERAAALPDSKHIERTWVAYDDISPAMRLAVVASEDQTFPYNHGFDISAIEKAMEHNEHSVTTHGASTITQQTAKNLFLWPGGGYFRKGVEAWFTVLIDLDWPKWRVLEVYLNVAQFGPNIFGVEAAAEHYFGKHASRLTRAEAALLAVALPDPYALDPAHPSPYLLQRRHWILEQMDNLGGHYLDAL